MILRQASERAERNRADVAHTHTLHFDRGRASLPKLRVWSARGFVKENLP